MNKPCMFTFFSYHLIEIFQAHGLTVNTKINNTISFSLSIGLTNPLPDCIVDVESMDIFPVGWCEANGYPLTHLQKTVCKCQILMESYAFSLTV